MDIERLVADAAARGTSDIHVVCGVPVKLRINGLLQDADDHILTDEDCEAVGKALAGDSYESIAHKGELDLAATIAGHRVRINLSASREVFRQPSVFSTTGFLIFQYWDFRR